VCLTSRLSTGQVAAITGSLDGLPTVVRVTWSPKIPPKINRRRGQPEVRDSRHGVWFWHNTSPASRECTRRTIVGDILFACSPSQISPGSRRPLRLSSPPHNICPRQTLIGSPPSRPCLSRPRRVRLSRHAQQWRRSVRLCPDRQRPSAQPQPTGSAMTDSFRGAMPARRFAPLLALLLSSMLGAGNALALNEKEFTADCVRSKRRLSASSLLRKLCGHLSAPRQARVPRGTARQGAPRQRCVLGNVHRRPRFVTRPLHGGTCTSHTAPSPLSVPVVDCRHDVPLPCLTCVRPTRRQPRRRVCAVAQAQGRWAVRKQPGRARRMPLGVLWQHYNRPVSVPAHVSVSTRARARL